MNSRNQSFGKNVMVTGANGHVGLTLTKLLVDNGYTVRASVRDVTSPEKTKPLENMGVELVELDITDKKQFIRITEGLDGLFHVAAVFKFGLPNPEETIIKPNVVGTINALEAAKANSIKRVVLTSSGVAIGNRSSADKPLDESNWNRETKVPYQLAKTRAEEKAWEFAQANNIDIVSINPNLILGPNFSNPSSSIGVVKQMVDGDFPVLPPFGFNITDVREVAAAHLAAYEIPEASGRYIIGADQPTTVKQLFEVVREVDPSVEIPNRSINKFMFVNYARFTSFFARLRGQIPQITTQQAKEYSKTGRYVDISKMKNELSIFPRPLVDTVRDTLDWLSNGKSKESIKIKV